MTFFSLGLVLYAIAQAYAFFSHDSIIKHTVRCPYCRKYISEKVWSPDLYIYVQMAEVCSGKEMRQLHQLVRRTGGS